MHNKSFNPYQDLSVVRNAEMFFGRTTVLRRIYSAIIAKQCISLVGTRHIGKSSILAALSSARMQEQFEYNLRRFIFVTIDLRTYRQKTSDYFFESVSDQIKERCQDLQLLSQAKSGPDAFSFVLEQIAEKGFYPVLLLDAFDNIEHNEHFDLEFFSFLRANAHLVSYITASVAPLNDICRQDVKESPFFNIFSTHQIGPLTPDEAQELASIPAQRTAYPFTAEEQEWICMMAGRHPFFIQRACHWLFEEKLQHRNDTPDFDHIEELVYKELHPHFDALWRGLSEHQQNRLKTTCVQQQDVRPKTLPEMSESALFRRFLHETQAIYPTEKPIHLTIEDIESLLANLYDLRRLSESNIKHLKVVTMRIKESSSHSPTEIGQAIQEILKEALERLKGTGDRKDNADEWRLYNILHYRYFQRHRLHSKLNSEQLAATLEYASIRQYYRDRNKAIEALTQVVLEMEGEQL